MITASNAAVGFIGCDVGKTTIVVFDSRDGRTTDIPNRPQDLASFAKRLDDSCLVVCEATGGHEATLLDVLVQAGIAAHRADARKVKAFIRSFGTLGKTDAINARALAEYGQERAWGAALVLIAIVMALNLLARLLGRLFAPKTAR